ncbi:MAG: type II 3-dehydroquinate dehydratase [Rhodobiaceae bacterium]
MMTGPVKILAINGPNLNMLGTREPDIYGADTLADMEAKCRAICEAEGATLDWMPSNGEGDIVTTIQQAVG